MEEYLASGTLPPSEDFEMTSCDNVSKEEDKVIVKDTEEMDIVEDNSVNASQSETGNCDDIVIGLENINTSTKRDSEGKIKNVSRFDQICVTTSDNFLYSNYSNVILVKLSLAHQSNCPKCQNCFLKIVPEIVEKKRMHN